MLIICVNLSILVMLMNVVGISKYGRRNINNAIRKGGHKDRHDEYKFLDLFDSVRLIGPMGAGIFVMFLIVFINSLFQYLIDIRDITNISFISDKNNDGLMACYRN